MTRETESQFAVNSRDSDAVRPRGFAWQPVCAHAYCAAVALSMHLIPEDLLRAHLRTPKAIRDTYIEIARILCVPSTGKGALDALARSQRQRPIQIEHCLLPVRWRSVRPCAQRQRSMTPTEMHVEEHNKGMNKVISLCSDVERRTPVEILRLEAMQIQPQHGARVCNDLIDVHIIHEGLGKRQPLNTREIETVDVLPKIEFFTTKGSILDPTDVERCAIGKEMPVTRFEPAISGEENALQHALVEEKVAHPFRYDNIDKRLCTRLWVPRQLHLFDLAGDDLNYVVEMVRLYDLARLLSNVGTFDSVDFSCACASREKRQNTCPCPDVEDDLAIKNVPIVKDRSHVGLRPRLVFNHLFVNTKVAIGSKIVVAGTEAVDHRPNDVRGCPPRQHHVEWLWLGLGVRFGVLHENTVGNYWSMIAKDLTELPNFATDDLIDKCYTPEHTHA